ncbi:helix-turn-helix domain-containing protein [Neorhizobium sp. LMR1-1-1.1]
MSVEKLKELREATHLTQAAFAKAMGVPLRTYENLESGRVDVRKVHLNAAKLAIIELLSDDEIGIINTPDDIGVLIERAYGNLG